MAIQSIKRLEDYVPAGGAAGNNTEIQYNNSGTLGASSNLTFDGTTLNVVGTAGIGLTRTEGTLHVHTSSAGVVTASTLANDLVVEKSGDSGISLLAPTANKSYLMMGAPNDNEGMILWYEHLTGDMAFEIGGGSNSLYHKNGPQWSIGDTSNANQTLGLTINQGAGDDEILAFKSSDVAHGMTVQAETDTYGKIQKSSDTTGGLLIRGLSEATISVNTQAMGTTANTSKSTTGVGFTDLDNYIKSGTSVTTPSADANLLSVRSGGQVRFIVDAEGDYHYDGTGSAFDTYADAELTRALTHVMSDPAQVVRSRWDDDVRYNEDDLVKAKLIGYVSPEEKAKGVRPLVNGAQLQRLHHGAIWQLHQQIRNQEEEIKALREQRENDIAELRGQIIRLQEKN